MRAGHEKHVGRAAVEACMLDVGEVGLLLELCERKDLPVHAADLATDIGNDELA